MSCSTLFSWAYDFDIDAGVWGSCHVAIVGEAVFVSTYVEEALSGAEVEGVFLPKKQEKHEQEQSFFVIVGKTKKDESRKTEIWKLSVLRIHSNPLTAIYHK